MASAATTKLSTKGQLVVPKAIRDRHNWKPGTKLTVVDTAEGMLVKAAPLFPLTRIEDVAGCLKYDGPPVSLEDMDAAVEQMFRDRYARGRY